MPKFEESLSNWNDLMVQKYHKDGTRFEKGFFLKRKMELGILKKMIKLSKINSKKKIKEIYGKAKPGIVKRDLAKVFY